MKLLNKVKISLLISLFIIMLFHIKAFAVEGTVTEITVNVREKASTDSKKVMYVTQDDKVEVLEKVGDWYKIKAKDKTGYVFGKYIKVDDSKLSSSEKENKEQIENQTSKNEEENKDITTDAQNKLIVKNKTQIRIVPNISSSVIYTASKDTEINIIEQSNNWTYISIENSLGWVRTDNIIEENAVASPEKSADENSKTSNTENKEEATTKIAYIKYDTVNLREKASTSSKSLAKLKLNDEVTVIEEVDSVWCKVEAYGKTGYISTDLLDDKKQEEKKTETSTNNNTTSRDGETTSREESTTTQKEKTTTNKEETTTKNTETTTSKKEETTSNKVTGEDIVAYAKKYLGYKYVYGGTSPSTGFDCSGFTYYVYKHFGYTLSRSSVSQATNGTKVEKKDLQPGDLVIYKNTSLTRIGHVGIYIGDNKMIHASEPGVGVIITDIDSKAHKYPQRYVMGRRIIK